MIRKSDLNLPLPSRRTVLTAGVAGAAAAALAACTPAGGSGPNPAATVTRTTRPGVVTLSLWAWSGAVPGPLERWNETHPKIQVELTQIAAGLAGGYQKMQSAIKAGNTPDLGQIEYPVLPSFVRTGGLMDLSPYGAQELKEKYPPVMWGQVAFGDGVFAMPRDAGPMGLYYRSDLFEKYDLAVPTTWEQFAEQARALREKDDSVYFSPFIQDDSGWLTALCQQSGAEWFSTSGDSWQVGIDTEPTQRVADFWQELLDDGVVRVVNTGSPSWGKALSSGTLLTYPAAVWGQLGFNSLAPQLAGKWRAAALPAWGGDAGTQYGGSAFSVFEGTEYPQEANEFVTWLGNDDEALGLLTTFGDYPTTLAGQDLPEANAEVPYFGGQNIYPIFREALNAAVAGRAVWGPTMTSVFTTMSDGLGRATSPNPSVTLREVFTDLQRSTIADMKDQGFTTTVAS